MYVRVVCVLVCKCMEGVRNPIKKKSPTQPCRGSFYPIDGNRRKRRKQKGEAVEQLKGSPRGNFLGHYINKQLITPLAYYRYLDRDEKRQKEEKENWVMV